MLLTDRYNYIIVNNNNCLNNILILKIILYNHYAILVKLAILLKGNPKILIRKFYEICLKLFIDKNYVFHPIFMYALNKKLSICFEYSYKMNVVL
jgi:hypothetical protein